MRIGGEPWRAAQFVTEVLQLLFGQAAFQERAGVNARGSVSLKIHQVPRLVAVGGVKKVVEADFQQGGQRCIRGNMPANAGIVLVLTHHHRHSIPAQEAFDAALHGPVARVGLLIVGPDGVDIRGVQLNRKFRAATLCAFIEFFEQEGRAVRTYFVHHLIERFQPFRGLPRIEVHNPFVQLLMHLFPFYSEPAQNRVSGETPTGYKIRCLERKFGAGEAEVPVKNHLE